MNEYTFWQVLDAYKRKVLLRDEALRAIAEDSSRGEDVSDLVKRAGALQKEICEMEQIKFQTNTDLQF